MKSSWSRLGFVVLGVVAVAGCGDDGGTGGGGGGGGASTTSTGTGTSTTTDATTGTGGAGTGGSTAEGGGGAGGIAEAPEGTVVWTVDGNSHQTTAGFPATADVQKSNPAVLTLTVSATDAVTFDSINMVVSVSAPSVTNVLAAGTYECAPANQLPSVGINAGQGGVVYGSTGSLANCSVTFDDDVNVGTPVKGSASGTLDGNGTAVEFTMSFNLVDIPG